ncbi:hypothetical protein [Pseudonocardia sp. TRM90224]|uniref:hypothetical protein n=1 Tax=Pseudonocardia sp. TRM90224 TaxID=2812678 RepID=UPI001E3FD0F6|nr:hypothetical protein [Pseudonocardia sp. TRM90224]
MLARAETAMPSWVSPLTVAVRVAPARAVPAHDKVLLWPGSSSGTSHLQPGAADSSTMSRTSTAVPTLLTLALWVMRSPGRAEAGVKPVVTATAPVSAPVAAGAPIIPIINTIMVTASTRRVVISCPSERGRHTS